MSKIICWFFASLLLFSACDIDSNPLPNNADARVKFLGTWLCTDESVVFGTSTFTIQINSVGTSDSIQISNWYNLGAGTSAIALVVDNSMVFPGQSITGISILGSGIYNTNDEEFVVTFTADDGLYVDQVSSTCRR